jgi:hypothetical protein
MSVLKQYSSEVQPSHIDALPLSIRNEIELAGEIVSVFSFVARKRLRSEVYTGFVVITKANPSLPGPRNNHFIAERDNTVKVTLTRDGQPMRFDNGKEMATMIYRKDQLPPDLVIRMDNMHMRDLQELRASDANVASIMRAGYSAWGTDL